jgi:hypothetical protein
MRRPILLATTLLLGVLAAPAGADPRVNAIVEALREDPVFVSSALSRAVPPAEVARLWAAVARSPVPAFVVVAPAFSGEAGLETLDALPDLLHDGLGRPGLYLVADRSPFTLRGEPVAPCFFDPRHGPAVQRTRWRLGGQEAELPACKACAKAVATGRAPVALEDRGPPYYEQDTLWARTGFGALDDGLRARVLAGEGRR